MRRKVGKKCEESKSRIKIKRTKCATPANGLLNAEFRMQSAEWNDGGTTSLSLTPNPLSPRERDFTFFATPASAPSIS